MAQVAVAALRQAGNVPATSLDVIPYVPLGQFDVDNAWRKNMTGVTEGAFNAYWNIDKQ